MLELVKKPKSSEHAGKKNLNKKTDTTPPEPTRSFAYAGDEKGARAESYSVTAPVTRAHL